MCVDTVRRVSLGAAAALVVAVAMVAMPLVLSAQSVPSRPRNLQASVSGSTVSLSWQRGTGSVMPSAYQLEVGSVSGASNLLVTSTASTSVVAPNVANGTYWIRVRAVNSAGASAPSNEVSALVGCASAPAVPTGVTHQVSGQTVVISWAPSAGATGYLLEAGTASGLKNLGTAPLAGASVTTSAPPGTYYVRVRAFNACGASAPSAESVISIGATAPPPVQPPPSGLPIWPATLDSAILGTCSAAVHDRYTRDGGDGYRYRTWHPQVDPSGCVFAHEHGDDPNSTASDEIRASLAAWPIMFGYIAHRHPMPGEPNGHEEPHEGFKVFVANRGEVNDEARVNRVYSVSTFHMGTGGPSRFTMQHHSADIRVIHPEFGLKAMTQLMMDTGGTANVCNPRVNAPVKDVVQLNSPCILSSAYEIWGTTAAVYSSQGREVYRSFATPAVFDPITVRNPSNPSERVYAWDPRMASSKVHNDDWSRFRGCERESYAQPGYWNNASGPTSYYTNPMGQPVPANHPYALQQIISQSNSVGAPATTDGQHQFKKRRNYCTVPSALGLKN